MIPVVMIHWGEASRYSLPLVMEHDRKFGNCVILLSDQPGAGGNLGQFMRGANRFAEHYEHLSTNHYAFELACVQRWFALREWMDDQRREQVLYTDSDVLLYCNAEKEFPTWGEGYALTLALGTSPATAYITRAGLHAFCDFVNSIYVGHNQWWDEFHRIYAEMRAQNLPGGIADMTLFRFFKQEVRHVKVGEMAEIRDGATWDHNINSSDGYRLRGGIKAIDFVSGGSYGSGPYGDRNGGFVRFNALHFQDGAKHLIGSYAR